MKVIFIMFSNDKCHTMVYLPGYFCHHENEDQ